MTLNVGLHRDLYPEKYPEIVNGDTRVAKLGGHEVRGRSYM